MPLETTRLHRPLAHTATTVRLAIRRWDVTAVIALTGAVYLLVYLYAIGNLAYQPGVGRSVLIVDDPISRMFDPGPGRFAYEPIAVVDLWIARYLFSPVNTAVGVGVASLVAVNLGLSYLAVIQPKACGLGATSGLLASVPAVFAGGACCAPVALLVFGITAGGTLLAVLTWLLPVGVALLLVSLVYLAGRIDSQTLST